MSKLTVVPTDVDMNKLSRDNAYAAAMKRGNEWVSVEDRLPENRVPVLAHWGNIHSGTNNYTVMRYADTNRWEACSGPLVLTNQEVTHWRPLPEPPKEEE